jgi:hypothetical protein
MDATLWTVAFAVAFGFMLGAAVVSLRFVRLERARRATIGAASGIARVGLDALPTRSAADILSGLITIVLGGLPYVIQVLPRRASREWLARLDDRFAAVTQALDSAENDVPKILALLTAHTDYMVEMLREYDVNDVLPDNEFIETYATDGEILAAMVEVWRAANPLAAIGAEAAAETMAGIASAPLNSSPENTDGALTTSNAT